uniref:Uncharacterized protein n=1 Tax=Globisporangium ultimum (strain ATCC 200006 / CBS 805.95 / DAOM BR144) TaxID=431595 RepID=K3WVI9_GLOUD
MSASSPQQPSVLEIDDVNAILREWCACVQNMTRFEEAALHVQQPRFALVIRALMPWNEQLHDVSASANRKRKAAAFGDDDRQSHEQRWTQLLDAIHVLHLLLQSADEEFMMMTPGATEHLLQFLYKDIDVVEKVGWNMRAVKRKDDPVDALLRTFTSRTASDSATQCNTGVGFVLDFSGCKQIPETAMDSLRDVLQRRDPNALCQASNVPLQKLLQASRYDQQKQRAPVRLGLRFWNCAVSLQTLAMLRSCVSGFDSSLQSSSTHVNNGTPAFQLEMLDLSENVLSADLLDNAAHLIQSMHIDALSLNGISNGLVANEAWQAFLCMVLTRSPPSAPIWRGATQQLESFIVELAPGTVDRQGCAVAVARVRQLPSAGALGVTELDLSYNRFDEHDVEVFARTMASFQPPQDVWYDEPFLIGIEEEKTDDGLHAEHAEDRNTNETVAEWICLAATTVVRARPLHWWSAITTMAKARDGTLCTKVREAGLVGTSARVTSLIMDWYAATTHRGDPDRIQVVKQLLKHIGSPLESLRLRGSTLSAADVHDLLALCLLQRLDIESCGLRDIASVVDTADSALLKLQSVNLRHNPLTSKDHEALAEVDTKFGISSIIWYFSE